MQLIWPQHPTSTSGIPVFERTFDHVRQDLHVVVGVFAESLTGRYDVFVFTERLVRLEPESKSALSSYTT